MSKFDFQKAIYKYAVLLAVRSIVDLSWIYYFYNFFSRLVMENQSLMYQYISSVPVIINYLFNIVFAVLVYRDLKLNQIKSPVTVIVTLLFGFIGIALFFIQVIYNQSVKKADTAQPQ